MLPFKMPRSTFPNPSADKKVSTVADNTSSKTSLQVEQEEDERRGCWHAVLDYVTATVSDVALDAARDAAKKVLLGIFIWLWNAMMEAIGMSQCLPPIN